MSEVLVALARTFGSAQKSKTLAFLFVNLWKRIQELHWFTKDKRQIQPSGSQGQGNDENQFCNRSFEENFFLGAAGVWNRPNNSSFENTFFNFWRFRYSQNLLQQNTKTLTLQNKKSATQICKTKCIWILNAKVNSAQANHVHSVDFQVNDEKFRTTCRRTKWTYRSS